MESKFKGILSQLAPVATGTKASNDTVPTITVLNIPNKFQLNRLATDLMGLKVEDRVRIFQFSADADLNERYFIAKTSADDLSAAKTAASNSATKAKSGIDMAFSYSGVWSVLIQNEVGATELGYEAMVEKGCVVKGETSGNNVRYRSANAVKLEVQEVGPAVIEGVEYERVFVLTNYKCTAKTAEELAADLATTKAPVHTATESDEADNNDAANDAANDIFKDEEE